MTLSREDILATSIPSETVYVPEWDGEVIIRGLTAAERDAYEQSLIEVLPDGRTRFKRNAGQSIRTSLVVRCLVDGDGKRLFSDKDIADLGEKSGMVIDRLWGIARRLSGMGAEAEDEAVEDFSSAQGDGNSSE